MLTNASKINPPILRLGGGWDGVMRTEIIGDATLILGDCRAWLAGVPPCFTADAVVTSPPYAQQRDYGSRISDWRSLVSGAMSALPSGGDVQVLVNLGLVHRDGEVIAYWDDLVADMRVAGWRLFGWYVWDQGPGMPGDWQGRLAPAHEFIFHFNMKARRPNKTTPSRYAGYVRAKPQGGLRRADGSMSGWSHGTQSTQDAKIPDSVIRITRHKHIGGIEAGHPAVFPSAFAAEMILAYTDAQGVVLDPFMGSGSTGVAALEHGRRFVGIEIDPGYFDIACRRIAEAHAQPRLFAEPIPKPVQETLF